jgi:hypothetical protein
LPKKRRDTVRSDTVFSTSSLQAYVSLVFLSGIALALSIQPSTRIAALRASDVSYPPGLFHISLVFFFGVFAISRGAVLAANIPARLSHTKLILRFLEHIAYGLLLVSPYLLFSRSLVSSGAMSLIALVLYVAISSLFFCLVSLRLEQRSDHREQGAFLLRYGSYFAFSLVPFGVGFSHPSLSLFLSASPVGFASRLIGGASALEVVTGFLIPILGILWILTRRQRFDRRPHAV